MKTKFTFFLLIACNIMLNAQSFFFNISIENIGNHQYLQSKEQALDYRLVSLNIQDYFLGGWEPSDSVIYVYDDALPYGHGDLDFIHFGNILSEPLFNTCEWKSYSAGWVPDLKYTNQFTIGGLRFVQNIDKWDGTDYISDSKIEYTYNPDNSIATEITSIYSEGIYSPTNQIIYNYSTGQLVNITAQYYSGGWVNSIIAIYSYNADGIIETITDKIWDGVNWGDYSRTIFTYDDNNLIEELIQYFSSGWENEGRYVHSYITGGFLNETKYQYFDGVDFIDYYKNTSVEFENGLPSSNIVSYWDGFVWNNLGRYLMEYEAYDDGTVAIENPSFHIDFNVFPNPASDIIRVEFTSNSGSIVSLIITNNAGEIVNRQTFKAVQGKNQITKSITELPTGTYRLSVIQNGIQETKSFIIQ